MDSIIFESISFLKNSVEYLSKTTSPPFQIWGAELGVWLVLYFIGLDEIVYSFFNFFTDTFWNSIYSSIYHSFDQMIWFMINFFLSKRAVLCFKYELSLLNCNIFCPSSRYHGQKPTILIENCDQAIYLGLSILFLYAILLKVLLFKRFIFELEAF